MTIQKESILPDKLRASLIEKNVSTKWRKTTTYPPHLENEYFLKENKPDFFKLLSDAIDQYGHDEDFYSRTYRYLVMEGYRYWHFDTLVNRETLEKYYARQK